MTEPYGYGEPQGFDSLRSAVDSEINNNRKTDEQQSEDIQKESEINEEQAQQIEELGAKADEAKETAEAAQETAENAQAAAEAAQETANENAAAIEVLNGDGEGSVQKTVDDAIAKVIDEAPEAFDTLKEIADYIEEHGEEAAAMMSAITDNANAIAEETSEREAADEELKGLIDEVSGKVETLDEKVDEKVTDLENADRAHDSHLAAHDAHFENHDSKLAELEAKDGEMEAAISGKVSQDDFDTKVGELETKDGELETAISDEATAREDADAALKEELEDEIAEAVLPYFDGAEYDSDEKKIVFKHGDEVKAEIDATNFIKDGMVDSVVIDNGNLVITFNEDSGKQAVEIPISEIFDADNYYNKDAVDALLEDKADTADMQTALGEKVAQADYDVKVAELEAEIAAKTAKEINGTNGKALMFNEADGGGAKFEHADGTWSFAGVNDGGEDGIAGQIYALKKNASNKMEGARIDVSKGGMYYTVGDAAAGARMVADNEIAVKGDITAVVTDMVGDTDTLSDISDAAVVDGDDIILSGGEF